MSEASKEPAGADVAKLVAAGMTLAESEVSAAYRVGHLKKPGFFKVGFLGFFKIFDVFSGF